MATFREELIMPTKKAQQETVTEIKDAAWLDAAKEQPRAEHEGQGLIEEILRETANMRMLPDLLERPDAAASMLMRAQGIDTLRLAAVRATHASQWLLWRGEGGEPMATMNFAAATIVQPYFKIQINVVIQPREFETDKGRKGWECYVDVHCGATGVSLNRIRGKRFQDEQFIGRDKDDLPEACYTLAVRKATSIMAGLVKTPAKWIAETMSIEFAEFERVANKGRGYGTSAQRRTETAKKPPTQRAKNSLMSDAMKKDLVTQVRLRLRTLLEEDPKMPFIDPLLALQECGQTACNKNLDELVEADYKKLCEAIADWGGEHAD